ncbi:MAG: FtsX-like permease family protein [Desulfatiglans sp.]|nr:FtsX-like permease family protein [Desulfatiglans sp.]
MFLSFIKITLRILYREKVYAIINIAGLSIAIACCLILGMWLRSELTYDQHHKNHRQIYRVESDYVFDGSSTRTAVTSRYLGPMLAEEYPEVRGFVRFRKFPGFKLLMRHEEKAYFWGTVFVASDNVFDAFTHNIIYGDPKTALVDPASMAVSETFSRMYFGDTNPIGKTIESNGKIRKITLVFADLPENSHLRYDALFSFNDKEFAGDDTVTARQNGLWNPNDYTYLLMSEDYNIRDFKSISDAFFKKHMAEIGKTFNGTWNGWLQPLKDIHFNSRLLYDEPAGNRIYVYGFLAVAVFILLVACINYMNLATARAAKRAKEVGIQKILGSGRSRLMFQFVGESLFFSIISLFLGLVLIEVALKLIPLNQLMGKNISLNLSSDPLLLISIIAFGLILGLLSGLYPAIHLSAMKPLTVLIGRHKTGKGSSFLRQLLVLVQFIVSVSVIACTLLMAIQMQYVSSKSLGFNKENRLIVTLRGADLVENMPTVKKELINNHNVLGMAFSTHKINNTPIAYLNIKNNDNVTKTLSANIMAVSQNFVDVIGMELIAGRDFSKEQITDKKISFIISETVAKNMKWEQPLGKSIEYGEADAKVIGVVKDFHHESLKSKIQPFVLRMFSGVEQDKVGNQARETMIYYLYINIRGNEIAQTLDFIKTKFEEFDPEHPFEFEFLDDTLNKMYLSETNLMGLIGIFAGVCIFISCLGLFGLAAFTTELRTKEIGIRKVLGASTWKIILMLASRILLLVLGGSLIASLIAYYAMDEWLADFAYRISINQAIWVFFIAAAVAACVAFMTIVLQSLKTAQANPVEALRHE